MSTWIKNQEALGTSPGRQAVLQIIEAGFEAIDTERAIKSNVALANDILTIDGHSLRLTDYKHIYVIGIGKASGKACHALEEVLGSKINDGVAIGLHPTQNQYVKTYGGNHPTPSVENVELSQKIIDLSQKITDKDLVIVVVSGGGSALLCWPMSECKQSEQLYHEFLKTGGTVKELNLIRKHLSEVKGGGLAKHLYPARVISLIMSDIPGDHFDIIASGPTYKDHSTVADAQEIIEKYNLGKYELVETPKDEKYFVNVTNVPILSNTHALNAMITEAAKLGLKGEILSAELYDSPEELVPKLQQAAKSGEVVVAGGEPQLVVTTKTGTGGRCQRVGMVMLPKLTDGAIFAAIASDGLDNSAKAGVIEDAATLAKMKELGLDYQDFFDRFDSLGFYSNFDNVLLETGPTETNVSDFMVYYQP